MLTEADIDAVHRVKHCASREDGRPALRGVVVQGHQVLATDSYRIAWHPTDTERPPPFPVLLTPEIIKDLPVEGDCIIDRPLVTGEGYGALNFTVGRVRLDHITPSLPANAWPLPPIPVFHQATVDKARVLDALAAVKPRYGLIALHSDNAKLIFRTGILAHDPKPGPRGKPRDLLVPFTDPPDWTHRAIPYVPWLPTVILDAKFFRAAVAAVAAARLTITVPDPLRGVHIQGDDELLEQILMTNRGWRG